MTPDEHRAKRNAERAATYKTRAAELRAVLAAKRSTHCAHGVPREMCADHRPDQPEETA